MSSFFSDPGVGGDGSTTTDDRDPQTGLDAGGWKTRFIPALAQIVAIGNWVKARAVAATEAAASALQSKDAAGISAGTAGSAAAQAAADRAATAADRAAAVAAAALATQVSMGGATGWASIAPTLRADFANGQNLSGRWTFSRNGPDTYMDPLGVLRLAGTHQPVIEWGADGACRGMRFQPQRANHLRNNTMQGAAAGTPGTPPTNWIVSSALATTIVGTGVEDGIDYVDIRCAGTAVSGNALSISFETVTNIVAAQGQAWTASVFTRLVSGNPPVNASLLVVSERQATGAWIAESATTFRPGAARLIDSRAIHTRTLASALTGRTLVQMYVGFQPGEVVDFTVRIGLPQHEQGASATSPIRTSGTAVTRPADVATMSPAETAQVFNPLEGTLAVEFAVGALPLTGAQVIASIHDAAQTSRVLIRVEPTRIAAYMLVAGTTVASLVVSGTAPVPNQKYRLVLKYSAAGLKSSLNGAAEVASIVPASFPVMDRVQIGGSGTEQLGGWMGFFYLYAKQMTAAQAVSMSGAI